MARLVVSLAVALVSLALLAPGCGSPPPAMPEGGTLELGSVRVDYSGVGGVHQVGGSPCPQPIGTLVIRNEGSGPVRIDIAESAAQLDVYVVDTSGSTPWTGRDLGPGERIEVALRFNCASTADLLTEVTVTATPTGGTADSDIISVTLDIMGAP
jgi:hypothetical protein